MHSVLGPAAAGAGARPIQHARREERQQNMATLPLRNGILIRASSRSADAAALSRLIEAIDLARDQALVRHKKLTLVLGVPGGTPPCSART